MFDCSYLGSQGSKMTDSERDQIDTEAESFMKTCSEAIKLFKQECRHHFIKTSHKNMIKWGRIWHKYWT